MVELQCSVCNKTYERKPSVAENSKYCSRECQDKGRTLNARIEAYCANCGKEIITYQARLDKAVTGNLFCDAECHREYHRHTFNCEVCGKEVNWKKSRVEQSAARFCSQECSGIAQRKTWQQGTVLDWYYDTAGYMIATARGHPLANKSHTIRQHWHVFWKAHDYADWIVEALQDGATIHHKNGKRDDNHINNLELRINGQHPRGISVDDAIDILENLRYVILEPENETS